jgi:hypothetical protein
VQQAARHRGRFQDDERRDHPEQLLDRRREAAKVGIRLQYVRQAQHIGDELAGDRQRERQEPCQPADPQAGDHLGDDHEAGLRAHFWHRWDRRLDGREEQHGYADSEADAHHRGRLGLAQAWQQHDRGANACHDQHETECPRRQRGKQRGCIISHEPPMTIRRSSSVWV